MQHYPVMQIHVRPPRIRCRVSADEAEPRISFIARWRPVPPPSPRWVELFREAPFGTQTVAARELGWDGQRFSLERPAEGDIEAFAAQIREWEEYANQEYARQAAENAAERALAEGRERAELLERKLRGS